MALCASAVPGSRCTISSPQTLCNRTKAMNQPCSILKRSCVAPRLGFRHRPDYREGVCEGDRLFDLSAGPDRADQLDECVLPSVTTDDLFIFQYEATELSAPVQLVSIMYVARLNDLPRRSEARLRDHLLRLLVPHRVVIVGAQHLRRIETLRALSEDDDLELRAIKSGGSAKGNLGSDPHPKRKAHLPIAALHHETQPELATFRLFAAGLGLIFRSQPAPVESIRVALDFILSSPADDIRPVSCASGTCLGEAKLHSLRARCFG